MINKLYERMEEFSSTKNLILRNIEYRMEWFTLIYLTKEFRKNLLSRSRYLSTLLFSMFIYITSTVLIKVND